MSSRRRVLVAGGGVGGLAAAIALRARGFGVEILEADASPRITGSGLGIHAHALGILRDLGVGDEIGHRLTAVEVRGRSGRLVRSLDLTGTPTRAIARNQLIAALAETADVPVHYGAAVTGYRVTGTSVAVQCSDGREFGADVLVGADGFRSAIRRQIAGQDVAIEYGYIRWLATAPIEPSGLVTQFWGPGQRFGIVDLGGGQGYWWGTKQVPVETARAWTGTKDDVATAFAGWPDAVRDAIAATPGTALGGVPAQDRPFLEQWGDGPVTLLGDAAHPMLASSASFAIEDAAELAAQLDRADDTIAGLRSYEDARRAKARALVSWARRLNHIEHLTNPAAAAARDVIVRLAPQRAFRAAPVSEFYPAADQTHARQ